MTLFCDSLSVNNISKKHVQHSKTKHIDIHHHLIRDLMEDIVINLEHITTDKQLAYIFTKPLDAIRFENLRSALRMCILESRLQSKIGKYARRPNQYLSLIPYDARIFMVIYWFQNSSSIWYSETCKRKILTTLSCIFKVCMLIIMSQRPKA